MNSGGDDAVTLMRYAADLSNEGSQVASTATSTASATLLPLKWEVALTDH